MKVVKTIDSHNSLLTNREMAILSAQIDIVAITAAQTLRFQDIQSYFNSAEHYYMKLSALMDEPDIVIVESIRKSYYKTENLIETNVNCRTRKALKLLLRITKDFYFHVRTALQKNKYYFRVSEIKEKGLGSIPFYDDLEEFENSLDKDNE